MTDEKKCPVCGSVILFILSGKGAASSAKKIYCSHSCGVKAWRISNKEKVLENNRKRYARNPQKYRDKKNKWYYENQEKVLSSLKEKYKQNPDKYRTASALWRQNNPEKYVLSYKQYKERNREKQLLRAKTYRERHLSKIINYQRKYYLNNRELYKKHYLQRTTTMTDNYIKHLLYRRAEIAPEKLNQTLIDLKRQQLMTYRIVKQLIQTVKENQND